MLGARPWHASCWNASRVNSEDKQYNLDSTVRPGGYKLQLSKIGPIAQPGRLCVISHVMGTVQKGIFNEEVTLNRYDKDPHASGDRPTRKVLAPFSCVSAHLWARKVA